MNQLSRNLKTRLTTLRMTQKELAEQAGISQVMVHKLLSGKSNSTAKIIDIANVLQCQPEWLLYGKDKPGEVAESSAIYNVMLGPDIAGRVPLISWVQAGEWTHIVDNFEPGDAEEWQKTTAKVGPHAFALRVHGDSMVNPLGFPSIPEGSIIIVDPDSYAENGKIVVARLENSVEATLKKLIVDEPHRYLKPLNPDYKLIQINEKCTIVGVVRQVISDL